MNRIIQQGKFETLQPSSSSSLDSKIMVHQKMTEAIQLKFLDGVSFAMHNMKNILDWEGEKTKEAELSDKATFKSALQNWRDNKNGEESQLKRFFDLQSESKCEDRDLWALRGAFQKIRNQIMHLTDKVEALGQFECDDSSNQDSRNHAFKKTIFARLYKLELDKLGDIFKFKIQTSGLLDYYAPTILSEIAFSLSQVLIAYAPNFRQVWGEIQDFSHAHRTSDQGKATYNLAKLLYYYWFLPQIKSIDFSSVINEVLNEKLTTKTKYARYQEIKLIYKGQAIDELMKALSSQLSLLEQDDKAKAAQRIKSFTWKVFGRQFVTALSTCLPSLLEEKKRPPRYGQRTADELAAWRKQEAEQAELLIATKLNASDNQQIAFWTFAKLLDARRINQLAHELVKYKVLTEEADRIEFLKQPDVLVEILSLANLTNDTASINSHHDTVIKSKLLPFMAQAVYQDEFKNGQDDKCLRRVDQLIKYGAYHKFVAFMEEKEHDNYKLSTSDYRDIKRVDRQVEEREKLVEKFKENRNLSENEKAQYKKLTEEIDTYNWQVNRGQLYDLFKAHQLMMDILSRLSGFGVMADRNHAFFRQARRLNTSQSVGEHWKAKWYKDVQDVRNKLDHFHYLSQEGNAFSLIDLMNDTRRLVAHDRKLKNAVTQSIIKLFDRYNMVLKLKYVGETSRFEIASVEPKLTEHLFGQVAVPGCSPIFAKMCQDLMTFKKT